MCRESSKTTSVDCTSGHWPVVSWWWITRIDRACSTSGRSADHRLHNCRNDVEERVYAFEWLLQGLYYVLCLSLSSQKHSKWLGQSIFLKCLMLKSISDRPWSVMLTQRTRASDEVHFKTECTTTTFLVAVAQLDDSPTVCPVAHWTYCWSTIQHTLEQTQTVLTIQCVLASMEVLRMASVTFAASCQLHCTNRFDRVGVVANSHDNWCG